MRKSGKVLGKKNWDNELSLNSVTDSLISIPQNSARVILRSTHKNCTKVTSQGEQKGKKMKKEIIIEQHN